MPLSAGGNRSDNWLTWAGLMTAEHPGGGAIVIVDVVSLYVDGVETGVLGHGLAVGGDPAGTPDVPCAVGWVQIIKEALLEVVEIGMKRWLAQCGVSGGS